MSSASPRGSVPRSRDARASCTMPIVSQVLLEAQKSGDLTISAPRADMVLPLALLGAWAVSLASCAPRNHAPVATGRALNQLQDHVLAGQLSARDEDSDRLTFAVVEAPV